MGVTCVSISLGCRRGEGGVGKSDNKATVNSQTMLPVLLLSLLSLLQENAGV